MITDNDPKKIIEECKAALDPIGFLRFMCGIYVGNWRYKMNVSTGSKSNLTGNNL